MLTVISCRLAFSVSEISSLKSKLKSKKAAIVSLTTKLKPCTVPTLYEAKRFSNACKIYMIIDYKTGTPACQKHILLRCLSVCHEIDMNNIVIILNFSDGYLY